MSEVNVNGGAVFRPSAIPKIEECLRFEPKAGDSAATARGTEKHRILAEFLAGKLKLADITDRETKQDCLWVRSELDERGIGIIRTEWKSWLTIAGERVWLCSIDALGYDAAQLLWLIDYKTGDRRDYSGQYSAYAKTALSELRQTEGVFLELNTDLRVATEYAVNLADSVKRTDSLYAQWREREKAEHRINQYCDWCQVRPECPAWRKEVEKAFALSPDQPLTPLDQKIAALKADPHALGEFYAAFKRLEKLVVEWDLKGATLEHLQNKREVPGFCLARDPSRQSVDAARVLELIVKDMGSEISADFITVSVPRLLAAWKTFAPDRPLPVEIATLVPETFHPKLKAPAGRGQARAAVKDRQA